MTARRRLSTAVVILVLAVLALSAWRPASAQERPDRGRAQVVDPSGRAIDGGGSATEFTLRLPDGASCPGDSANDGYRVNSYMVPVTLDPGGVTYDGLGPTPLALGDDGPFVQPLYDVATNSFVSAQTADARAPGEPGPIVNLPVFSFAVFAPGDVPAGRYHLGLVCTLLNDIAAIWDVEVIVAAAPTDEPAQLRWTVPGVEPAAGAGQPTVALAGATVALVALAAGVCRLRRRRPTIPLTRSSEER